jgi:hypothetical protein
MGPATAEHYGNSSASFIFSWNLRKSKSEEYEEIWMVPRTLVYENVPKETINLFIRQNLEKMIPVFVYLFFQNV